MKKTVLNGFTRVSLVFLLLINMYSVLAQGTDCSNATVLPINQNCQTTEWTNNANGSGPNWTLSSCNSGTNFQDVWFKVTGNGNTLGVNIFSLNSPDARLVVYQGCPTSSATAASLRVACTFISGDLGGLNFNSVNGTEYMIQIQRRSGGTDDNQNGSICVYNYNLSPCGNPLGLLNDFCENPATLTYGPGTSFSASTAGTFSADHASTIDGYGSATGPFCGLVHNNSWYKFIAGNTTESFRFTYTSCSGVQAHVYRINYNSNGCCNGFIPVGNCLLNIPSPPSASSIVTATGLTVGQEYMLMVDGYLGAECDFRIADWGAVNVLPVELSDFRGVEFEDKNTLIWTTDSEKNNDYFELLKSHDGENFEVVGIVQGVGNSTEQTVYSLEDRELHLGVTYYKLKQVDLDGEFVYSKILTMDRNDTSLGIVAAYPNPFNTELTVDLNVKSQLGGILTLENINGNVLNEKFVSGKGIHQISLSTDDLKAGLYILRFEDENGVTVKRVVKN